MFKLEDCNCLILSVRIHIKSFSIVECFRNIEFSDSIHRPGIKKKQTKGNTTFRKLDLFPSSGAGKNLFCWVP
jgi:hypothetical protein